MTSAFRPNIKQQIVLLGYSLLWLLLLPILGCHFVFQGVRGKAGYTKARLSRYGIVQQSIATDGLLIHCASVGEVVAIQGLVRQRLISHPSQGICISTNTTTGADRVKALFADKVSHCYLPYDFALFVWAFLAKIKPAQVLINEMELWPNLCHLSWKMNIPVSIINGRMSDKSCRTYQKAPSLFVPMFNKITTVCAQGQRDYDNYLALGVHSQRLFLTNNIKFDLSISQDDIKLTEQLRQQFNLKGRLILVAGSTHDPEEQILVDAYRDLYKRFPELLLIIVPRHPERFDKVHKLLMGKNINVSRLSEKQPCVAQTQVLLCDQMGWLRAIYGLATVAFVGGSLVSRGGHNALEPAAVGAPILMGPSRYNNPEICQALQQAGALCTVEDAQQITAGCLIWLQDLTLAGKRGALGTQVLEQNSGAISKTLSILNQQI